MKSTLEDLSNEDVYKRLKKNPIHLMEKDCNEVTDRILKDHPDEKFVQSLNPYLPTIPHYYSLWKTHKEGYDIPPRRPVVSKIDNPLQNVSILVSHILGQVMAKIPTNIKSSDEFITCRKNKIIQSGRILLSSDIKALYTNIPLRHSRETIISYISDFYEELDTFGVSLVKFDAMMEIIFSNGYFCFDNSFWKQIYGLPMGDNPAPAVATIYVYLVIEKPVLENDFTYVSDEVCARLYGNPGFLTVVNKIDDWKRYLDDTYSEFNGSVEEAEKLMTYINQLHDTIKFPDSQVSDTIDFLDFTISINNTSRRLEFELFVKPSNVGIFLSYDSAHPKSVLLSVAENELRRAVKRSNTESGRLRSLDKIKMLLLKNGYPTKVIEKCMKKVQCPPDEVLPRDFIGNKNVLKLQYIDEQHRRKLLKELKKYDIIQEHTKIVFMPGPKVGELLIKSKLNPIKCNARDQLCYVCLSQENPTNCMLKNYVYLLTCSICKEQYVGESGRLFRKRMREHFLSVANKTSEHAMGAHFAKYHSGENINNLPFECELLRKCKDFVDRKLWQSIEVKERKPAINKQLMACREYNTSWKL